MVINLSERLSEFSYGYGVTREIELLLRSVGCEATPFLPSLIHEEELGFNVGFSKPGRVVLAQFKLGQELKRFRLAAHETAVPALDHPFWQFRIDVAGDDELPGFGVRVFASGKRSYLIQYRAAGRTRRYTIGLHGVWTPETVRQEARVQLGHIAKGDNPAEERQLDHQTITVNELCDLYLKDLEVGLTRLHQPSWFWSMFNRSCRSVHSGGCVPSRMARVRAGGRNARRSTRAT